MLQPHRHADLQEQGECDSGDGCIGTDDVIEMSIIIRGGHYCNLTIDQGWALL